MSRGSDETRLEGLKREFSLIRFQAIAGGGEWTLTGFRNGEAVLKVKKKHLATAIEAFREAYAKAITAGLLK